MAFPSLRRYDVQARFAFYTSLAAVLPFLAALAASFKRYDHQLRAIQFGEGGVFRAAFLVCIALASSLSVLGIVLGFSSAGQRRNKEQGKSWAGFFIGTAVLSVTIVLFFAFRMLKFEIITGV